MIIYRIFLGFVESVFFIHLCLWFQSVRCSSPWPLLLSALFRHAHWYFFKFFCTQENSSPFPFLLKRCVFTSILHRTAHGLFLVVDNVTFPFPPLRLSLAWKFSSVLSSAHTLQRWLLVCPRRISLPGISSAPQIRRHVILPFCQNPDGMPQRWKLQHTGELFKTHFWHGSLPWKPDWHKAQI